MAALLAITSRNAQNQGQGNGSGATNRVDGDDLGQWPDLLKAASWIEFVAPPRLERPLKALNHRLAKGTRRETGSRR